jgi:hypothetical protein
MKRDVFCYGSLLNLPADRSAFTIKGNKVYEKSLREKEKRPEGVLFITDTIFFSILFTLLFQTDKQYGLRIGS